MHYIYNSIFSWKTDIIRRLEAVLQEHNAYTGETFWEIGEHSPVAGINAGLSVLKRSNADVIVSVGGGSPVDASKTIIYRLHQENPESGLLLHIAIPTTLSAAEYTVCVRSFRIIVGDPQILLLSKQPRAGYTNEEGVKVGVAAPELVPAGIILDAELTIPTPERLWYATFKKC